MTTAMAIEVAAAHSGIIIITDVTDVTATAGDMIAQAVSTITEGMVAFNMRERVLAAWLLLNAAEGCIDPPTPGTFPMSMTGQGNLWDHRQDSTLTPVESALLSLVRALSCVRRSSDTAALALWGDQAENVASACRENAVHHIHDARAKLRIWWDAQ